MSRHGRVRHAVRLAAITLLLTASGCPLSKREQEGGEDVETADYVVTVTPATGKVAPSAIVNQLGLPNSLQGNTASVPILFLPTKPGLPGINVKQGLFSP